MPSNVPGWLDRLLNRLRGPVDPTVFVTGMPKSGTTAIVKLMGLASGQPAVNDPLHRLDVRGIRYRDELYKGSLAITELMDRFPEVFRGALVKDPNFVFFHGPLQARFPDASWVFTVRDPRDNIRSVLNRLGLPGRATLLGDLPESVGATWRRVLEGRTPDLGGSNPIENLALRWARMADIASSADPDLIVSRYEDFMLDKEAVIAELCRKVGLEPVNSVAEHVDRPFQPPGDRNARWEDFFGPSELAVIRGICGASMARFGYDPDARRR